LRPWLIPGGPDPPAREVEQPLDDAGDPRGLLLDDRRVLGNRLGVAGLLVCRPSPAGDDVERRADLVGDLGGDLADGRELFGVGQALLEGELGVGRPPGLGPRLAQRERHVVEPGRDRADLIVALGQEDVGQVAAGDLVDAGQELGHRAGHHAAGQARNTAVVVERGDHDHPAHRAPDVAAPALAVELRHRTRQLEHRR
jgi:hypothetical protein